MALLENFITFQDGVPRRFHATDHAIVEREIIDPLLGIPKRVRSLMLFFDEVDGERRPASLSILSDDLANQLAPLLPERAYRTATLVITKRGFGFLTKYSLERLPR